jgi:2-polyprenyl-3-methyl-5-hydroxy-6-metoxy-1,4-benzoquinol methylase
MSQWKERFLEAEQYRKQGNYEHAVYSLSPFEKQEGLKGITLFKLGEIYNDWKKPKKSFQHYLKAFEEEPQLASKLLDQNHVNSSYTYEEVEQHTIENCPLCSGKGEALSCYPTIGDNGYVKGFLPVRLWMACTTCSHVYAYHVPKEFGTYLQESTPRHYLEFKMHVLPLLGTIVSKLKKISPSRKFLEIGIGGGEMLAVAKEYGFDVEGNDIRTGYAQHVSKHLHIPIYSEDFNTWQTNQSYGVIAMGDVIEHMVNPIATLKKAADLLHKDGILWISTPNRESAHASLTKEKNPYWCTTQHFQFFSYHSLENILNELNFDVLDYEISPRYNGSMEIIAKKRSKT